MATRNDDYSLLESFIRRVKDEAWHGEFMTPSGRWVQGTLIDPNWVCMLEDQLANLTAPPKRGRPRHDWLDKLSNPTKKETVRMVELEMKRLTAETGKKRVKTKAVNNVAQTLNKSAAAIWKRIGK
jgi:hypothetical protein